MTECIICRRYFSGVCCGNKVLQVSIDNILREFMRVQKKISDLLQFLIPEKLPLSTGEKLRSALAAFVGIFLVGYISSQFVHGAALPFLVASMGASTVLLFAISHSPLSQPWPMIGGNLFPALIAATCAKYVPDLVLAAAISVSVSIMVMLLLRCLHPPRWRTCPVAAACGQARA
jgi:CBS domain-containing membrane protein